MSEQASPEALDIAVFQSLARFRYRLRLFERFSEAAARTAGLTPSQHQLILAVKGWWGDEPPTIGDVAELLQLKHHSTVELAQRTEANGLIVITPDPSDGRKKQLLLSANGEEKLRTLSILHRDEIGRFRAELNEALSALDG